MVKFILLIILLLILPPTADAYDRYKQHSGIYLNYSDLLELSKIENPRGELLQKLQNQLNNVTIQQPPKAEPKFLQDHFLGDFFRVASWNIERGFKVDLVEQILAHSLMKKSPEVRIDKEYEDELLRISSASIIVLNEVDIGVPRTNYENIISRLALNTNSGYVFGTEFVEVDPYQLGVKKFTEEEKTYLEPRALEQINNINTKKYNGLHGTAILTKYPILNARVVRLPSCYKWFTDEATKLSVLELAKRGAAEKIFSSKVLTELRHGGRIAVIADLMLPNKQKITVVGTHLENRCLPDCRVKQLEFLLNRLRDINNPLILAGDFNTTGTDASPTSIKKEALKRVKDPEFIARQAILSLTPITLAQNVIAGTANALRNFKDPTTRNIPIILPNKERELFKLIGEFRFNDSNAFDIRGETNRSFKHKLGLFSNSNERSLKGFKQTFELEKSLGVAKYKLDWFFIKPLRLKNSNDKEGSYAYAPHLGRTLKLVNRMFGDKVSDHDPITVDIPITEPNNN